MSIEFNANGYAEKSGLVQAYMYEQNGCFSGKSDIFVSVGTSLPPMCTTVPPPENTDQTVAVWKNNSWELLPDNRGKTVYAISTGAPVVLSMPGAIDVSQYSEVPLPASQYLKNQAKQELQWVAQQASLGQMMQDEFSADMKTYVTAIRAIASGSDTLSTALPARPETVFS
ncbi:MAG: hypothetical protein ABF839_06820 [Acetobacter orientalis]|uniref:hypothetical protein n=1 Tax=Acetobacter orientalis TaxID=146474 RepID=UPI0039E8B14E